MYGPNQEPWMTEREYPLESDCPYGVHWCNEEDRCRDCLRDIEDDYMLDTHDDPWEE